MKDSYNCGCRRYDALMLTLNMLAPHWSAEDQDAKTRTSKDCEGSWLLLYFYPKDDTPGCTVEACGLRDAFVSLKDRITIIGVSGDDVSSHKKFSEKYALPFILVADVEKTIFAAYGVGTDFPKRVTFFIDPKGMIRAIRHGFDCKDHAALVEEDLKTFGL